ncbi:acyl-CoA dehydrogenase family protein [Mesorhizobium sp. DCY119]|uniref:acyl-CoA dehydrogenase family protein n=1 Tax=Mesorhizobium sp. DCY119 TaxID=2108445 RepID=UPI000E710DD3|nr:acyl-CoA dehydrogenase family protein [Mesorhizobium sp. DCY119]RJG40606.1 acyl-CoA dehydrogenase [Mesorhizobium sp. DCY119]
MTAHSEIVIDSWHDPLIDRLAKARIDALAKALADGVVERDHKGSAPLEEAAFLRASGLLSLTIDDTLPVFANVASRREGIVSRWGAALQAIRRVARVDVSGAALLGYTYMHLLRVETAGNREVFDRAVKDALAAPLLWGGANNPRGARATLRRVEGGFVLDGRKNFATGSQTADRLVISEAWTGDGDPDGRISFILDAGAPGIEHLDDWTGIGVTRSASGGLVFRDVFVPADAVFSRASADPISRTVVESLSSLGFQILFVNLLVGAAQGSVETATRYLRGINPVGVGTANIDDPDLLGVLGWAATQASAAAALGDQAGSAFASVIADADAGQLSPEKRGWAADLISRAKVIADRVSLDVTSQVFEAVGGRGATVGVGLDRFWRDARTYTLHDSVAIKKREIGTFILRGYPPTPSTNS